MRPSSHLRRPFVDRVPPHAPDDPVRDVIARKDAPAPAYYRLGGLLCTIVAGSRRAVPGGTVVDVRFHDPRTTVSGATTALALLDRCEASS